ncbi:MAG: response regulator [Elusimicrobia bacterium]|nr:response regulator [Elusimicrobiota bacterium]MDE2510786.1 response regulator [Elusimicrobiota bacterium]
MTKPAAREHRRIMVVDDDAMVRETVRLSLEHAGFEVRTIEDASTAVDEIRAAKPDLVVLDMYIGDVDGRDVARALKKDPATAKTPIVFFTASDEAVDVVTGLDTGAVDYIGKPIDGEVLISKIRHILKLDAR